VKQEVITSLLKEVATLRKKYRSLHLKHDSRTAYVVGELSFVATYKQKTVRDCYAIEVEIPDQYPKLPPETREIGGRIDRNDHVNPDGTMCLGPPIEVLCRFRRNPTLEGYIENLVIPKLFWHSYNREFPDDCLPGYSHGDKGITEFRKEGDLANVYLSIFRVKRIDVVLQFLRLLSLGNYSDKTVCPCGSRKRLKICHGDILNSLAQMPHLKKTHIAQDFWVLEEMAHKTRRKRTRRKK